MSENTPCQRCGHCCTDLIIEITELDVLREPRLLPHAELLKNPATDDFTYEDPGDREYMLMTPCPFFKHGACEIYPTRPNVCVGFRPGSEQCRFPDRTDDE